MTEGEEKTMGEFRSENLLGKITIEKFIEALEEWKRVPADLRGFILTDILRTSGQYLENAAHMEKIGKSFPDIAETAKRQNLVGEAHISAVKLLDLATEVLVESIPAREPAPEATAEGSDES